MAANTGVALDTIVIEIESNAEKANNNLVDLTKTLTELKSALRGGFNNLNKLSEGLSALNKASAKIPKTIVSLKRLSEITTALKSLSSIEKPLGMTNAIKNISRIPEVFNSIDTRTIENVKRVSQELSNALTPLANKMSQIGEGFSKIQMLANRYGISVTKIRDKTKDTERQTSSFSRRLSNLSRMFRKTNSVAGDFGKVASRQFTNLYSKIKQVYLSLLGTRTLFTAVRKAVSEYAQMDAELSKETQNLWRALGAQLAPAIEYVLYLFKQAVRVIYSIVYALTGIDLVARANAKALSSMGKSAKDTLGSLQKFDDLNVVEFDKGNSDNNLIELDKIDLSPIQRVIDWMRKLKEEIKQAWSSGQWDGVASVISDGIIAALQTVNSFITKIDWYQLGETIRSAILSIDWGGIVNEILNLIKTGISSAGSLLDGLFGTTIFTTIADAINNIIDGVQKIGTTISKNLGEGTTGGNILSTIKNIFDDISKLATDIYKVIKDWVVSEEFQSVMSTISQLVEKILGYVEDVTSWISEWYNGEGGKIVQNILKYLTKIIDECLQIIIDLLDELWTIVSWLWNHVLEPVITGLGKALSWCLGLLGDIISFIKNVFRRDWENAFKDLANIVLNVWNLIVNGFKNMINKWIGYFEKGINWIIGRLNKFIKGINNILGSDLLKELGISFTVKEISTVSIPRLATGTNEIPYEGLYHLHQGEAVVPKKYNPALGNGGSDETNQKLDTLIAIMNNMNFTNVVNLGNKTLYKEQQKYNSFQNDKYGTTVNI